MLGHVGDLGEPCDEGVGFGETRPTGLAAVASALVVQIDFIPIDDTVLDAFDPVVVDLTCLERALGACVISLCEVDVDLHRIVHRLDMSHF